MIIKYVQEELLTCRRVGNSMTKEHIRGKRETEKHEGAREGGTYRRDGELIKGMIKEEE